MRFFKCSNLAQRIRKEYLGARLDPDLGLLHLLQVGNHIIVDAGPGAWQRNSTNEEHHEHDKGECGGEIDDLLIITILYGPYMSWSTTNEPCPFA